MDAEQILSNMTPEKIAIMKLTSSNLNNDLFTERPSSSHVHRNFDSGSVAGSVRGMRSSSKFKSSSRRSSSFMSSHRQEMSRELTAQAESKFFALMELMASASKEASSLKEFWAKILAERESYAREREELLEQVSEFTQELEQRNSDHHHHDHESGERKKQVEKLLVELSVAIGAVAAEKKKLTERDHELERTRRELHEVREIITHSTSEHDKLRTDLEMLTLTLAAAESDRDGALATAEKHQRELHKITRERTEFSTKLIDITSKYEMSRKEHLSIVDRLKMFDLEREELSHEIDRLKEDTRKAKSRADESSKEVLEITEKYERSTRDVHKLHETIRTIESERDEHAHTMEHLRRELKMVTVSRDEADDRCSEFNLKYEHIKRELLSIKEKLRDVELERNETLEVVERTREQHRLVIIERDELKEEVNSATGKVDEGRRRILVLTESLRKTESLLTEVRSETHTLTERIKVVDRERDDAHSKHGHYHAEILDLKEKIVLFQAEIRTITEHRERIRGELERTRAEYEEITETITEFKDGSSELEFEIESLRTMLREVREQKERAIAARNSADRERDEYITKYEEKCREMERFEESAAEHYHAHASGHGGGHSTTTRIVSTRSNATHGTSGTAIHNSD